MSIILATFFISLSGIILMIGRKLLLTSNHHVDTSHNFIIDVPEIDEIKHITGKKVKRFSYILLVITLRIYVLAENIAKKKYSALKNKIQELKNKSRKNKGLAVLETKEANKFLKTVSDYRTKINKIKQKIKEEEGLN